MRNRRHQARLDEIASKRNYRGFLGNSSGAGFVSDTQQKEGRMMAMYLEELGYGA
jgi:hypothetical protein